MLTSEQMDELITEGRFRLAYKKTAVYVEFIKKYGENADWEEWLHFLDEHPGLKGFEWVRSLRNKPLS
jgi:hypothetical protein